MELNDVERQVEEIRNSAIALGPVAVAAIESDLRSGNGALGMRLLENIGAIGENALRPDRNSASHVGSAVNVLVQSGATVNVASPVSDGKEQNATMNSATAPTTGGAPKR